MIGHKGPAVFSECWEIYNDTMQIYDIFNVDSFDWLQFAYDTGLNLFWNYADIVVEMQDANDAIKKKDYYRFGTNIGKIASDVFVKNPTEYAWNYNNSDIMMAMGNPTDLISLIVPETVSTIKKLPERFLGFPKKGRTQKKSSINKINQNSLASPLKQEVLTDSQGNESKGSALSRL